MGAASKRHKALNCAARMAVDGGASDRHGATVTETGGVGKWFAQRREDAKARRRLPAIFVIPAKAGTQSALL